VLLDGHQLLQLNNKPTLFVSVPHFPFPHFHVSHFQSPRCGLEQAARKFLSAPPTSVASEQLFSAAGQIYSDRRNSLLGENAEKLSFWHTISDVLKYWSLHAELMLPNDWRSEWYSRLKCDHGFIKKYFFFVHLLFHVATTSANHNRNYNQICIASQTEALNVIGLFRSLRQWQFFYFFIFRFWPKMSGLLIFFNFSARKWNFFFGTFYFSAEKKKILLRSASRYNLRRLGGRLKLTASAFNWLKPACKQSWSQDRPQLRKSLEETLPETIVSTHWI